MPHVIVKLWPGKSERQKARLADAIVKDVTHLLGYGCRGTRHGIYAVCAGYPMPR